MASIEFVPGSNPKRLTERSKKLLKDIFQAQEVSRFIKYNELVGYKPNPDDPDGPWPWPWPGPPWWHLVYGDPSPQPSFPNTLQGELLFNAVLKSDGYEESFSFIDAIKREGIFQEALKELSVQLSDAQKSIESKMKALG